MYPSLCESKTNNYRCAALTSLSQPCLPVSNVGPTRILPFLYLGSQQDALSQDVTQVLYLHVHDTSHGLLLVATYSSSSSSSDFLLTCRYRGHIHNSGPPSRQLACCTHGRSHTRSPGISIIRVDS